MEPPNVWRGPWGGRGPARPSLIVLGASAGRFAPKSQAGGAVDRAGAGPLPARVYGGGRVPPAPPSPLPFPGFGGRPDGPAAPPASGDGVVTGVRWPRLLRRGPRRSVISPPPTDAVIFSPEVGILCHQRGVGRLSSGDGCGRGAGFLSACVRGSFAGSWPPPDARLPSLVARAALRAGCRVLQASRGTAADPSGLQHPRVAWWGEEKVGDGGRRGLLPLRAFLSPSSPPSPPHRHAGCGHGG